MYFDPELVSLAFKRLSPRESEGKTHLERTSALMYFLAIDAVCKEDGVTTLDLNPDTAEGKKNRKLIELEFSKLVLLESSLGKIKQVKELGKVCEGGLRPEKRISSNFFTRPLCTSSDNFGHMG